MLMARLDGIGLDGIQNKIHPGDPIDKNLYDLPPEELIDIPVVCGSLREALGELRNDHAFLLKGRCLQHGSARVIHGIEVGGGVRLRAHRTRSNSRCTIQCNGSFLKTSHWITSSFAGKAHRLMPATSRSPH
jgi:hypothetical protein